MSLTEYEQKMQLLLKKAQDDHFAEVLEKRALKVERELKSLKNENRKGEK